MNSADQAACDRCGDFAPLSVLFGDRWRRACLQRQPWAREPVSFRGLVRETRGVLLRLGLSLLPFVVLVGVISGATQLAVHSAQWPVIFVDVVLFYIAYAAVLSRFCAELAGHPMTWRQAFTRGPKRLFQLVVAQLASALLVGLGLLVFIGPGLLAAALLLVVDALVVHESMAAFPALEVAMNRSRGHHKPLIAALVVVHLPSVFLHLLPLLVVLIQVRDVDPWIVSSALNATPAPWLHALTSAYSVTVPPALIAVAYVATHPDIKALRTA